MNRQQKSSKKSWGGSRPGAGRNAMKPIARKKQLVVVRMTDGEKKTVCLAAERAKLELSEWIRETLFASAKAA